MDPTAILMTFGMISIAELGDKTQLATVLLSTRYGAREVFAGALAGISAVNCLSIALGNAISGVPGWAIAALGASIFIFFGLKILVHPDRGKIKTAGGKGPFTVSLATVALMELGDKTQFSVLALSARFGSPLSVFMGAFFAYAILMAAGVMAGSRLAGRLPLERTRRISGVAFILVGIAFALSAFGFV